MTDQPNQELSKTDESKCYITYCYPQPLEQPGTPQPGTNGQCAVVGAHGDLSGMRQRTC